MSIKAIVSTAAMAAVLSVGALAMSATTASAAMACNASGECWHTDHRYQYAPAYKVQVHPDSWYFHRDWQKDHTMQYRDHHDGRGYYRNGVWITF